nr:transcriptional corepressor LEUNIG-like isoform X2 [Tanacetum cinerariifolium]
FHPKKEDCICSCDENEIRFWTIMSAGCTKVSKGGASLVRFQLGSGKHLAGVIGKSVVLVDLENPQGRKHALKPGSSIRTFTGHSASVMSLDFHPKKEDCICSCDENEIRFWTIMSAGCTKVSKGGASLVRFQLGSGKHLAGVIGKSVVLVDLENPQGRKHALK